MTTEEVAELVDPGMEIKRPVLEWLNSEPVRYSFEAFLKVFL